MPRDLRVVFFLLTFLAFFVPFFFDAFFFAIMAPHKRKGNTHATFGVCTRSSKRTLTRLLTPGSSIVMP